MSDESEELDEELQPPTPQRVAARAMVIAVVTCRGFIERQPGEAAAFWRDTRAWFDTLNVGDEVESWERDVLDAPLGKLESRQHLNAQWLSEGLALLAWALKRFELRPYDRQVEPSDVGNSLGFLAPRDETVLGGPGLRSVEEILAVRETYFSVHWRLRQFSLDREKIDFAGFAETAWFGPLSLEGVRLVDGDLAIGAQTISKTSEEALQSAMSIAQERHRAANWLAGECSVFSDTETNT